MNKTKRITDGDKNKTRNANKASKTEEITIAKLKKVEREQKLQNQFVRDIFENMMR